MFDFDELELDGTGPELSRAQAAPVEAMELVWPPPVASDGEEDFVEAGLDGRFRGLCSGCRRCRGWAAGPRRARAEWEQAEDEELAARGAGELAEARGQELRSLCKAMPLFDGRSFLGQSAGQLGTGTSSPSTAKVQESGGGAGGSSAPCGRCGCPEHEHEIASQRLGRFLSGPKQVPLAALRWSQVELALWGDTGGAFRPGAARNRGCDAGRAAALIKAANQRAATRVSEDLVSVICPTTASRRCFHRLLWHCFEHQDYEPRELVIVDTCEEGPSAFFQQKAESDLRVVYKHYRVPEKQWSIGVKRNLACYYSAGKIIAHFDDDDMYAPCYLSAMVRYLNSPASVLASYKKSQQNAELAEEVHFSMNLLYRDRQATQIDLPEKVRSRLQQVLGPFSAACAKLSSWYTFSVRQRTWAYYQALAGKPNQLYGWGFSLVYLRRAWEVCPFLHINLGEDLDFVQSLRELRLPVILAKDDWATCVHTQHRASTSGECKIIRGKTPDRVMYGPLVSSLHFYEWATQALLKEADEGAAASGAGGTAGGGAAGGLAKPDAPQHLGVSHHHLPIQAWQSELREHQKQQVSPQQQQLLQRQLQPQPISAWQPPRQQPQQPRQPQQRPRPPQQRRPSPEPQKQPRPPDARARPGEMDAAVAGGALGEAGAGGQAAEEAHFRSAFAAPSKCVGLTLAQALALQDDLIDAYTDQDFQRRLHAAWESCDRPSRREVRRRELCLEVQGPVIARYGFEGSAKGMFALAVEFDRDFPDAHEIHIKAKICRWLTQPEAGTWQELGSDLAATFADKSVEALAAVDLMLTARLEARQSSLRGSLR